MQMRIAVACGDPLGVGPEVTLKALAATSASSDLQFSLFGDFSQLSALNSTLRLNLNLQQASASNAGERYRVFSVPTDCNTSDAVAPNLLAARTAMHCLKRAAEACLSGEAAALVTAPVCKESIIDAGFPDFVGQTEYLSALAGTDQTVMMLLGADDRGRWLRVALATVHLALRRVPDALSAERIELAIARASQACLDLGLKRARVGVCGLNPHAGEGGKMGTEELTLIAPAVNRMRAAGLDVVGPLPADTLFHYAYKGDYDAVVAMYHDQGLAPLKMIGFESGINWSLGLPFIRTSPDHGTAFDIAGQGIAHPGSMVAALNLAERLARVRVS